MIGTLQLALVRRWRVERECEPREGIVKSDDLGSRSSTLEIKAASEEMLAGGFVPKR
jgi:hypothetical protein